MLVGMMREFRLFVRLFGGSRRIKSENRSVGKWELKEKRDDRTYYAK